MNAEYDRNAFDGSLSYDAAEADERARLDAKLRADDLDLDAWLVAVRCIAVGSRRGRKMCRLR